ncbi:MAG TPA: TonB-dependent receptor [Burkholderiales bacterium]|nr:TonB-dependent receptor [Burkholderiales bacterium]
MLACAGCLPVLAQQGGPVVEVIGTTPLPGVGVPRDSVPANVQTGGAAELRNPGVLTVPDFMERGLDSVTVNAAQGNPFQPDVNFRGFTASPLLGTQPGLSVFQDGVRVNEPFGDSVNWDLIPKAAISSMALIPGSNPVFGLNTLGGALVLTTKSGFDSPGLAAEAHGGSFGRRAGELEYGGSGERVAYFIAGNLFDETGWRDQSASLVRQGFVKVSYRGSDTSLDLSYTGASNVLNGAQSVPVSFLEERRSIAYTFPDTFTNELSLVNLVGRRYFSGQQVLEASAYSRNLKSNTFSTNVNDGFDPTQPIAPGNTQGQNIQDDVATSSWGVGLQYSYLGDAGAKKNRLTLGAGIDAGRSDFSESRQEANFANDRSNIPAGDFSLVTQARVNNSYQALYVTDTLSVTPQVDVTVAGRYNRALVQIRDTSGTNPALDGDSRFSRFNPAAGATWKTSDSLTAYANYNEGMRIPTPVELTCANPSAPCALPNAFLADPPLKPVIGRTIEAGLRGRISPTSSWRATAYQTTLTDDILFVSASAGSPNTGFFQNVGTTRRRGVELGANGTVGRVSVAASYAYIDARFRSSFTEHSVNNAVADANGDIQVSPGDRIPAIPQNVFKLRAAWRAADAVDLGAGMIAAGSQLARGNENNQDSRGKVAGYAVFNLDAHWRFARGWELFAEVDNLFNTKYETVGLLGRNFFNGPGRAFDANAATSELFLSPGAPLGAWIGLRYAPERG